MFVYALSLSHFCLSVCFSTSYIASSVDETGLDMADRLDESGRHNKKKAQTVCFVWWTTVDWKTRERCTDRYWAYGRTAWKMMDGQWMKRESVEEDWHLIVFTCTLTLALSLSLLSVFSPCSHSDLLSCRHLHRWQWMSLVRFDSGLG